MAMTLRNKSTTKTESVEELGDKIDSLSVNVAELSNLGDSIKQILMSQKMQNEKLDGIFTTVKTNEASIKDVKNDLNSFKVETEARLVDLEAKVNVNIEHDNRISTLERELHKLRNQTKIDKLKADFHSKKYNLIFHGIPEVTSTNQNGLSVWETPIETTDAIRTFLAEVLLVDQQKRWNFVNCHRLGMPSEPGKSRGIIVRFSDMRNKDTVMSNLRRLKDYNKDVTRANVFVQTHLPDRMQKQRKLLIPKFKEARALKKKTRWAVTKDTADYVLYINKEKNDSGYITSDDDDEN